VSVCVGRGRECVCVCACVSVCVCCVSEVESNLTHSTIVMGVSSKCCSKFR
jgi:hypothetical protein